MFQKAFSILVVAAVVLSLILPPAPGAFSAGTLTVSPCGFNLADSPYQCDDNSGGGCAVTAKICEADPGLDGDYESCADGQGKEIDCDNTPGCQSVTNQDDPVQPLANKADCQD